MSDKMKLILVFLAGVLADRYLLNMVLGWLSSLLGSKKAVSQAA